MKGVGPLRNGGLPAEAVVGSHRLELVQPYDYVVSWAALASSADGTNTNFTIKQSTMFLWVATSYFATIADAPYTRSATPVPPVLIQFMLANTPFGYAERPLTGFAGGPHQEPRPLANPFWLKGDQKPQVTARSVASDATTYNIWITFHGGQYAET